MKRSICLAIALVAISTILMPSAAQRRASGGEIKAASEGRTIVVGTVGQNVLKYAGCGCYFSRPRTKAIIFFSPIEEESNEKEAWMNIDGRDVKMQLLSTSDPPGNARIGSRFTRVYAGGGLKVQAVYVTTRLHYESASFAATFTIMKLGTTSTLKAEGGCGC